MIELENNFEIVGILSNVEKNEKNTILTFSTFKKIELPTSKLRQYRLEELKGTRIGLGHFENKYLIRKIK